METVTRQAVLLLGISLSVLSGCVEVISENRDPVLAGDETPIAESTPAAPEVRPTITAFVLPASASVLSVPVSSFTATGEAPVVGFYLSENPVPPSPSSSAWFSAVPKVHFFSSPGKKTLYAFVKDRDQRVSEPKSAAVTITLQIPSDGTPAGKLLLQSDLVYKGAFRVPKGKYGVLATDVAASFSYGGGAPAYNPIRNSLILQTHWTPTYSKTVAEISIPDAVNSLDRAKLNTAVMVQNPIDIANGQWDNLGLDGSKIGNGGSLGGLLVYNNALYGAVYGYYDAAYQGHRSHFRASLDWDRTGTLFQGMYRVGVSPLSVNGPNGGFVGGYMGHIPPNWQAALGGPVLTGKGAISIISRSSFGPSAWVFNPMDLGAVDPVPATPVVYYPGSHPTLGNYGGTSLYYNMATQLTGIVFPEGSRTVLFFGRHGLGATGLGDTCYGPGTSDLSLVGTLSPGFAEPWCYDPSDSSKGTHGYPYVSQVWAYDAADFLKVKNGVTNPATDKPYQPWEIVPYGVWRLDLPFKRENAAILGAAYDPATQRIFVSQAGGDAANYDIYPMIHVFEVQVR